MTRRGSLVLVCALLGCGARQATRTSESLFESPAAQLAEELAPDMHQQAVIASTLADEAQRQKDQATADDHRTESRLWLMAAVAEAERVQLDRRREELERDEERWAKQLARDQRASAEVAGDIARYRARAVALREAQRVSELGAGGPTSPEAIEAIMTRVRLSLALAQALGASDRDLGPLRDRAEAVARRGGSAEQAEALLYETEVLIGKARAEWPSPLPGASIDLVESALAAGFAAERTPVGVVVRSQRFFEAGGKLSERSLQRFAGLLSAFPHGPVSCQVAVPDNATNAWELRVARLAGQLSKKGGNGRVSTGMVVTSSLDPGTVQCAFAAYREP